MSAIKWLAALLYKQTDTRTVIVEVKYINSKNVVIHSESCKVEIPLDITAQHSSKKKSCMTGIYEAGKKRGFTDCSTEMFDVDSSSICS